jgi:hypothetical protein
VGSITCETLLANHPPARRMQHLHFLCLPDDYDSSFTVRCLPAFEFDHPLTSLHINLNHIGSASQWKTFVLLPTIIAQWRQTLQHLTITETTSSLWVGLLPADLPALRTWRISSHRANASQLTNPVYSTRERRSASHAGMGTPKTEQFPRLERIEFTWRAPITESDKIEPLRIRETVRDIHSRIRTPERAAAGIRFRFVFHAEDAGGAGYLAGGRCTGSE